MPRCGRQLRNGRGRHVLRSVRLPPGTLLRSEWNPILVHEGIGLLFDDVRAEPVHLRSAGLLVRRARSVLQRTRVPGGDVHLSAGHQRLQLTPGGAHGMILHD